MPSGANIKVCFDLFYLQTVNFSTCVQCSRDTWETFSYVWGGENETQMIFIAVWICISCTVMELFLF